MDQIFDDNGSLFCIIAGLAIPVGGFLAWCDKISPDWGEEEFHHAIIAFGGGT